MAYTYKNFRTKKALREALKQGETVNVFQPGPFPLNESGIVYLEGPYDIHGMLKLRLRMVK